MKAAGYKQYMVNLLLVILMFNYLDRLALGVVLQDIKADLALSDTQLGVLSGIAFALFYSIMGIPIARWADRGNRVTIIAITTTLWSGAVALSGAATTFVQLLLIRIGVAVGEAGCLPPAHSLIADNFTREERPRAVARYMLGVPLSSVIGFFVAGWLNEIYGWRTTFLLLGAPGVLLGLLAWRTLKEPRATAVAAEKSADSEQPGWLEVLRVLWSNNTFRHLLMAFSVLSFFGYGIAQWKPAFFIRSFGLETGELGTWFAIMYGVAGLVGTFTGGEIASRYAARNERLQLRAMVWAYVGHGFLSAGVYLAPNHYIAFVLTAVATVGIYMVSGPLFATMQTLVPARMRAMSIALTYLFANLIGMGLGPLAAGILSDLFQAWAGPESLRYALLVLCPGYLWVAWHLSRASRSVMKDLETAQRI